MASLASGSVNAKRVSRHTGATRRRCGVRVRHKLFKSSFRSWEDLCDEAAEFATTVGRDRLINISVSQADSGGQGVIFVWYWE